MYFELVSVFFYLLNSDLVQSGITGGVARGGGRGKTPTEVCLMWVTQWGFGPVGTALAFFLFFFALRHIGEILDPNVDPQKQSPPLTMPR